jgi:hypothetical protein
MHGAWLRACPLEKSSSEGSMASSPQLHEDGSRGPPRCVWGMGLSLELLTEKKPKLDLMETHYRIWVPYHKGIFSVDAILRC